jgi:multidrug resistance efflux pump
MLRVDLSFRACLFQRAMIRLSLLALISVLWTTASNAGEIIVESHPVTIEKYFPAIALPDADGVLLQINPKSWNEYQILELADHGSRVAKGDTLVSFDPEAIDKKIADLRRSVDAGKLTLVQTELDLQYLEQTAPYKLEAWARAASIAKEENRYFTEVRRKATEDGAAQALERKKQSLSNQQEELRQLTKMYAADDITEDTEEIILTRQKDAVVSAEFALRMESLDYKRTLEVSLPREAVRLANQERDTTLDGRKAEADIPRAILLKKIELESLKTNHEREKQTLAELQADRALFEFKAPADGWFYHGPIDQGRWIPGEAIKQLFKHGRPACYRPFATFVPASTQLVWVALLDEATARSLNTGLSGIAILAGREDLDIPVKLTRLAATPATDGSYRADFSATWPKNFNAPSCSTAQLRLISYYQESAIAIPTKCLNYNAKGWSVEVKLADGKTEHRPVKRGRVSKDDTEILSGLEIGQVVLTPGDDSKPKS